MIVMLSPNQKFDLHSPHWRLFFAAVATPGFEPFEQYMRLLGECSTQAFPWVKPELERYARTDLVREVVIIRAALGKRLNITIQAELNPHLFNALSYNNIQYAAEALLKSLTLRIELSTDGSKILMSEDLDATEESDILGALSYVRGVYDRASSNGVTQFFPLGWYAADTPLFKGQIHLTGRTLQQNQERVSGVFKPHKIDIPAEQLWGWYDGGLLHPLEMVTAEVVVTKPLDLLLSDANREFVWGYTPGEILNLDAPCRVTTRGVTARCNEGELIGFLRDRSLTFTH